jgi:hypothetical protein
MRQTYVVAHLSKQGNDVVGCGLESKNHRSSAGWRQPSPPRRAPLASKRQVAGRSHVPPPSTWHRPDGRIPKQQAPKTNSLYKTEGEEGRRGGSPRGTRASWTDGGRTRRSSAWTNGERTRRTAWTIELGVDGWARATDDEGRRGAMARAGERTRRRGEAREGECGGKGRRVEERAVSSARGRRARAGGERARAGELGQCVGEGRRGQESAVASARRTTRSGEGARDGRRGQATARATDGVRRAAALKTEKGARGREKVRACDWDDLGRLFSSAALRPTKINVVFSSAPLRPTKIDGVLSSAQPRPT